MDWRNNLNFATLLIDEVIGLKHKHLIDIDLDGTLLTDDKKISETSKQMIKKVVEEWHVVVIATGRSNRLSILYYNELELLTPLINSNGAVLHHTRDKNWGFHHTPLEHRTALDIIETCYELNSKNVLAAVHDAVYLDQFDQDIVDFYGPKRKKNDSLIVGRLSDKLKENPTLMLLYPDEKYLKPLTDHLNDLHAEVIDHRN